MNVIIVGAALAATDRANDGAAIAAETAPTKAFGKLGQSKFGRMFKRNQGTDHHFPKGGARVIIVGAALAATVLIAAGAAPTDGGLIVC